MVDAKKRTLERAAAIMTSTGLGLTGSRTDRSLHGARRLELQGQWALGGYCKLRLAQNPSEKSVGAPV